MHKYNNSLVRYMREEEEKQRLWDCTKEDVKLFLGVLSAAIVAATLLAMIIF